jgi:transglutaminase-like putative cysteine protease
VRFDIRYRCRFAYDQLVRESQNELRACPATDDHQQLVSYRVQTDPSARVVAFTDWFGTRVDAFGVRPPHLVLDVVAEATVETRPRPLLTVDPRVDALAAASFRDEHHEYLGRTPHASWDDAVAREASFQCELAGDGVVGRVLALHRLVGSRLSYAPGSTYVGVDVAEVLARGAGVCQDFAHLAVAMCRSVGIPARYVSGYLFTVDDSSGETGAAEAVRVQTHAWFEAAVPGFGWLALDPTNGLEVGPRHVKIGHGRDYADVQPLRGVYAGTARHDLDVVVDMRRLTTPRPPATRPTVDIGRLVARDEAAALRRAEDDRHLQQQQQQQQQ